VSVRVAAWTPLRFALALALALGGVRVLGRERVRPGARVGAGVNDVSGEVLTLGDARALARFASQRGLGLTSIWSLARDEPCAGGSTAAQATCSGVPEPPYTFSRAFGARPRPGLRPRQAVDRS